jgi:hypothetical protein
MVNSTSSANPKYIPSIIIYNEINEYRTKAEGAAEG